MAHLALIALVLGAACLSTPATSPSPPGSSAATSPFTIISQPPHKASHTATVTVVGSPASPSGWSVCPREKKNHTKEGHSKTTQTIPRIVGREIIQIPTLAPTSGADFATDGVSIWTVPPGLTCSWDARSTSTSTIGAFEPANAKIFSDHEVEVVKTIAASFDAMSMSSSSSADFSIYTIPPGMICWMSADESSTASG
ncbi:MAG: hypothetical protein M1820_010098 [Bogoriella megaspora]|nr:MAG: hypothetical protein M1820_010098 [Bogoriella megaspora]